MQKPFDASLARKSCHAFGRIDVHRLERVSAALYVQADSVYHGESTLDGCGDRLSSLISPWTDCSCGPASGKNIAARSGCREAMRTAKLASCRWRTIRRDRVSRPPNRDQLRR